MTDGHVQRQRHLAVLLMDPPFESSRTVVALRFVAAVLRAGHRVSVFAYEGAVALTQRGQKGHPNPVRGATPESEEHPLPGTIVQGLQRLAEGHAGQLEWVNCGYCLDERGVAAMEPLTRRGGPADFQRMINVCDKVVVVATR
jgi:tRNA 2-thiouridine synthesizing protein D